MKSLEEKIHFSDFYFFYFSKPSVFFLRCNILHLQHVCMPFGKNVISNFISRPSLRKANLNHAVCNNWRATEDYIQISLINSETTWGSGWVRSRDMHLDSQLSHLIKKFKLLFEWGWSVQRVIKYNSMDIGLKLQNMMRHLSLYCLLQKSLLYIFVALILQWRVTANPYCPRTSCGEVQFPFFQ